MKNKTGVVFILSLLALLFACVSKPLQIPLKDKNFYGNVHSIGIYVSPSGNEQYDRILYNLLSLDIITAGYDVVNLRISPSESSPLGKTPLLNGSHKKVLNKIQSGILNEGIDNSHIDALYVVSSRWKSFPMYYKGKRHYQYYEVENSSLKLSITTLDASTLEIVASSTRLDSADLFLDEATAKRFDKAENVYEFLYYPEPAHVLIQKCIDLTLGKIQTTTSQDTLKAKYRYPVIFYVDQKYREFYKQWKLKLKRRLLYANDIFKQQFDVEFYIDGYKEWYAGDATSFEHLSNDLMKLTSDVRDKFVIGITLDKELMRDWTDKHRVGRSMVWGNHIVIKDVPAFPGATKWDAIEEALVITHELGHSFGAPHVFDPLSVMHAHRAEHSYTFDPFNRKIIKLNIPNKLKPLSEEDYYFTIKKVIEYYWETEQKNMEIVPIISWLLSEDYLHLVNLGSIFFDPTNLQLPDSSIFYAVDGHRDYENSKWKTSLSKFEKALELNSEMPELYTYCSRICDLLDDQERSQYYRKKAEEMGYNFIEE